MKKGTLVLIGVVVVVGIYLFTSYNSLVSLNENADGQWAQVEGQYQRRFDLIPNLVNSVSGIFNQEQEIYTAIADARTRYSGATTPDERAAAATEVESSLGRLLVIVENYPRLESATTIRDLMSQLEGTENRVSVERGRFNETIRDYNLTIKRFPKNIVALLFGFDERSYFESSEGTETAPVVEFE